MATLKARDVLVRSCIFMADEVNGVSAHHLLIQPRCNASVWRASFSRTSNRKDCASRRYQPRQKYGRLRQE